MTLENSDMLTTAIAYVSLISQCLSIAACGGLGRATKLKTDLPLTTM